MRLSLPILFLTLVGTCSQSLAATNSPSPRPGLPKESNSSLSDYSASEALALRRSSNTDFQLHIGSLNGDLMEIDKISSTTYWGALISWRDQADRAWDFQADVTDSSLVRIGAARRYEIFYEKFYAPFWKIGANQTFDGKGDLAAFVDLQHAKAFVGAGCADLFGLNHRVSIEADLEFGTLGTAFAVQAGWVWDL